MKPNKKYLAIAAIIAVIAIPLLIKAGRGDSRKQVTIAVAAEQAIRPTILASGVLAYLNEVNLTSEVVAKVREILVKEGDTVTQGQLLYTMESEKSVQEVEAPADGTLKIIKEAGETYEVGTVIGELV